jgi:hypothetical protein
MTVQSPLTSAVSETLGPLGFRRRGRNWYRIASDLYSVVNIQKSRWSDSLYINLGFSPANQVDAAWLPEPRCMVRLRAGALHAISPEGLDLIAEGCPAGMSEPDLTVALTEKITAPLARLLEEASGLSSLGGVLESQTSGRFFVHREMRALIERSA